VDLKPWQQRLLFAVVVAGLAVLGVYLVGPVMHHNNASPQAGTSTPASQPTTPAPEGTGNQTPVAVKTPASVNIYNWLPFTQAGLANAAGVVTAFSTAYDSYRYTDSANVYIGRMAGLVTPTFAGVLKADFGTPALVAQRQQQRQVATATATINTIRAFGQSSITFIVTITQHVISTQGSQSSSTQFAITVTSYGSSWQVNDIELATAGNP
jgi:hypothetical protein